jgi:hypothetical protein
MITKTQQRYLVHLDVEAMAVDPYGAVQEAISLVRRSGARACDFTVEEVHERRGSSTNVNREQGAYSGEFLG